MAEPDATSLTQRMLEAPFLPPSFEVIPRLLLLLEDPEANAEALADLIRVDTGLTVAVLHRANSAYYGRGQRAGTVLEAITRMGLREIYRIVMKIVASPVLSRLPQSGPARLDLWSHSLTTAVAAQVLQRHLGADDPEIAFTAALLHDVGKLLMAQVLGEPYIRLLEECQSEHREFYLAEARAFKTSHAEVGAKLLEKWNFPEQIVSAVAAHHHPVKARGTPGRLAALIYAGNVLAYRVAAAYQLPEYAIRPDIACLRLLELDEASLPGYEEEVKQALDHEQRRFR